MASSSQNNRLRNKPQSPLQNKPSTLNSKLQNKNVSTSLRKKDPVLPDKKGSLHTSWLDKGIKEEYIKFFSYNKLNKEQFVEPSDTYKAELNLPGMTLAFTVKVLGDF